MANNLNDHIIIHKLAQDLGLESSAEPVERIVAYCRKKVHELTGDFDGEMTPENVLPWLEGKLTTKFCEIHSDADLAQLVSHYCKRKEHGFATLNE